MIYSFSNHVGHKIPTIENLGVAGPQDAIDFTDNDITSVTNFPLSPRLSTLLLARNRITNIQPNLFQSIPNLTTLVLSNNNVAELVDLDPLRRFTRLTHVSLIENPVARKEARASLTSIHLTVADITNRTTDSFSSGGSRPSASSTFRRSRPLTEHKPQSCSAQKQNPRNLPPRSSASSLGRLMRCCYKWSGG